MMKLYYSVTSPYSRKALLTAKSLGLGDQITLELGSSMEAGSTLHTVNPLAKVPALQLADGSAIFDSPVIVEYFLRLAGGDRTSDAFFAQLRLQALADGIMDAAVSTVMENKRPDAEVSAYWQNRWQQAILRSIEYTRGNLLSSLADWSFGTIGMACALDYLRFRLPDINWQGLNPAIADWFSDVITRPDMIETDPRKG